MKVAQYVADYLAGVNSRVYGVCGAGAMHLNDAIAHHSGLQFIAMHHEQAAAYAAEGDARVSGKIGICHVTAGPGGTNAITGIACAWADSIPMLVIAGQVDSSMMIGNTGLRQFGVSEIDMVSMVRGITKHAVTIRDPKDIKFYLDFATHLAMSGRKGPVFIEIPLDVQVAEIEPEKLTGYNANMGAPGIDKGSAYLSVQVNRIQKMLGEARRPLVIVGNGVRLADAQYHFLRFVEDYGLPVVSSWNGSDLISTDHPLYIGRPGIIGDRAGNFAVQNADLILAIGTRLSIPQIGHSPAKFAPNAKLVVVDIDGDELEKTSLRPSLKVQADAKQFLVAMLRKFVLHLYEPWIAQCREWKRKYPVCTGEVFNNGHGVSPYEFLGVLSKHLADDAVVVTDVGQAFVCTMQGLALNGRQRLFHASGVAPMGYGLPAAIGACMAGGGRQTVCLAGDGGFMFNLQELQTLIHHQLPICIFLLCNGGYKTIQTTQGNHFKRESVSSPKSGVSLPDFDRIATAFGLSYTETWFPYVLDERVTLALAYRGPSINILHIAKDAVVAPRVQSKMVDGKWLPVTLDDMWPHLPKDELAAQMVAA